MRAIQFNQPVDHLLTGRAAIHVVPQKSLKDHHVSAEQDPANARAIGCNREYLLWLEFVS